MRPRSLVLPGLLVALATLCCAPPVHSLEVPYLSGRVVDLARLLPPEAAARIEEKLARLEEETGAQMAVLTIDSLEGESLEDYSLRVAETWQLGRKGHDDGILLLIVKNDRKIRIEVGYGLEGAVPDVLARRVIDNALTPAFRRGDFAGGIERAVEILGGLIRGDEETRESLQRSSEPPWTEKIIPSIMLMFFSLVFLPPVLFTRGAMPWIAYLFLSLFIYAMASTLLGPVGGLIFMFGWLILVPILRTLAHKTDFGKAVQRRHPAWTTWSSSSGGGWSGGGGFSGGGGSFGGGGASGGW